MADDVWTALVRGVLAFGQSRAADLVGTSASDTKSFVGTLAEDRAITQDVKDKFNQLKQDIEADVDAIKPIVDAVKPKILDAKTAVQNMANELQTDPFTLEAAARAATEFAFFLAALDDALLILADKVSRDENGNVQPAIKSAIEGITEPWKKPFRSLGADAGKAFNDVAKQLLDVDNATKSLADHLSFDRAQKTLTLSLAKAGRKTLGPVNIEQTELAAFVSYKTTAVVGVKLKTKLDAGLRSDKLVEKVIPDGNNPSAESTMIQLDTDKGLSFGEGKNKRLTLPVSFSFPGIELREFMIGLPSDDDPASKDTVEVMATVAAKLGSVIGMVVEGTGVIIKWHDGAGDRLSFEPRLPTGLGMRIDAGPVGGGGFIKRDNKEYSGILDLKLFDFRITAIGMLVTEPFSFVVILSVQFSPAIELSFGFTLNGLGGILAIERRISTDELRKGIRDGTAETLLFPANPIDAAKTILDKVRAVFPPQPGGFVVGPIAEIGWGSQAGFVIAKVGLMIALPDPKLILLGAVQIGVPSAKVDPKLRIVDLHAEVYGEFTPEYLLILIGLSNSKIAQISISGDMGLLIRWAGGADFALSVGGFFPGYEPPKELTGLRRITIDLSPASFLSIKAEAYFAITTNSIQFGGGIHLTAKVGPAEGKAWLTLDALFRWSPRFYFEVRITAGLSISVFGMDLLGVDFKGTLKGTTPWSIEGHAKVTILFWDIEFDLGPFTWGEEDVSEAPTISPGAEAQQALMEDKAWSPKLPADADSMVYLVADTVTPLLVHPLGALEVKQLRLPLETKIDRIGSAKLTASRVNLANPSVQQRPAEAVSHSTDLFAPGHFIALSDDEQISRPAFEDLPAGIKVNATAAPAFGEHVAVAYEWETCFPHHVNAGILKAGILKYGLGIGNLLLATSPVAKAAKKSKNPYATAKDPIELKSAALREVRRTDDLGVITEAKSFVSATLAEEIRVGIANGSEQNLELLAVGVAS
jgi:hypothetical protein